MTVVKTYQCASCDTVVQMYCREIGLTFSPSIDCPLRVSHAELAAAEERNAEFEVKRLIQLAATDDEVKRAELQLATARADAVRDAFEWLDEQEAQITIWTDGKGSVRGQVELMTGSKMHARYLAERGK